MSARSVIRSHGGLAATWQLADAGLDRHAIRVALTSGEILRVRQGWYAEVGHHDGLVRAARVGGRITCSTALSFASYWVLSDPTLHVAVKRDRTQLRSSRDAHRRLATDRSRIRVHWSDTSSGPPFVTPPLTALRHFARCSTPEFFAATAESVMHKSPELRPAVRALASSIPRRHRAALEFIDGRCESGTETLFRWRMRDLITVPVQSQVAMPNVGDVDFLLGDRLVVEVDGKEYHEKTPQFEKDRERDASLSAQGFRVLRYSFGQVIWAWPTVERAVLAALARGDAW